MNSKSYNVGKTKYTRPYKKSNVLTPAQKKAIKTEIYRDLETKFSYNVSTSSAVDYNGVAFELFPTAQGTTGQTVVGNRVVPQFIKVKYGLDLGDSTNIVTLVAIQWKGGPPHDPVTGSDVWQAAASIISPLSAYDESNKHNFKVLAKATHVLDTYHPKAIGEFKLYGTYMSPVSYVEGDITVAPRDGGIYFVAISDSAVTAHPVLQFYAGIYYKDA